MNRQTDRQMNGQNYNSNTVLLTTHTKEHNKSRKESQSPQTKAGSGVGGYLKVGGDNWQGPKGRSRRPKGGGR